MSTTADRLYELLPVVHRMRDAEQGWPLRALLGVISEQVKLVEDDITQLYENWFIETCQDWVVPYLGDLIGHQPVHEAGEPGDVNSAEGLARNKILIPRRDVADTIRNRRRKGTLALLELLAGDVTGWPTRAVEFFTLLGWTQNINHLHMQRAQTVNLRDGDALDLLNGPFDQIAHTVDVRRISSHRTVGRYNIPEVGLFVWRLGVYSVTQTPAFCVDEEGPQCYTFSVLGSDTPLYTKPQPEDEPTHIADELNLPVPIRRRAFEKQLTDYYGEGKSVAIWVVDWGNYDPSQPLPPEAIIPADLTDWEYRPPRDHIAVDPVLGRIVFPPSQLPRKSVRVSYYYGFSADIGGGEYDRPLVQPAEYKLYQVGERESLKRISEALAQWKLDKPRNAIIELTDSGVYVEQIIVELGENQSLQLRAANRTRPVIRLLDWQTDMPDALSVNMSRGSRITLDGLLVTGRGVNIRKKDDNQGDDTICPAEVKIRHCTLVPGWGLDCDCEPKRPAEPSLELFNVRAQVNIEHSIVGSIEINENNVTTDPIPVRISDSVVDATNNDREAIGAPGCLVAHAVLTIVRSTVFGQVQVHAIELAENCIFNGRVFVARRQIGCMRFCYVPPLPDTRTPRRYNCQPDLVDRPIAERFAQGKLSQAERDQAQAVERLRVRPQFNSVRYGKPTYCQLAETCADEIKRGADDESEMGVFHDLFQPQRVANLRARLDEYTPAGADAGIIFVS